MRGNHAGTRWRGQIPIPPHCHPLVRIFIEAANDQDTTLGEIASRAGVSRATMSGWRYNAIPRMDLFQASLNVLGLELCIRQKRDDTARPKSSPAFDSQSLPEKQKSATEVSIDPS